MVVCGCCRRGLIGNAQLFEHRVLQAGQLAQRPCLGAQLGQRRQVGMPFRWRGGRRRLADGGECVVGRSRHGADQRAAPTGRVRRLYHMYLERYQTFVPCKRQKLGERYSLFLRIHPRGPLPSARPSGPLARAFYPPTVYGSTVRVHLL